MFRCMAIPLANSVPLTAQDVARGIMRLFHGRRYTALTEVPLRSGRRCDVMALGPGGTLAIVEIKVSVADLRGDRKWPDYREWCDEFYWGVPAGFDTSLLNEACYEPGACGLIVADRFDAEVLRSPITEKLSAPRRKSATLVFARTAAQRLMLGNDPLLAEGTWNQR